MTRNIRWLAVCAVVLLSAVSGWAQQPRAMGAVTKIDKDAGQVVIKNDAGVEVTLTMQPKGTYRRVAPGETDLKNASMIEITDINTGDRVLATGKLADDQKSMAATLIVVMSQADIANKQAGEKADWDKRGVIGTVKSVASDKVTLNYRDRGTAKTIEIVPAEDAVIRRYAQDSIKFADATTAKLGEAKVGDQLRARGDKTPDGSKMTADEIISGTFKTIAATINSIDAAQQTMKVTNLDGKKPVIVKINGDSALKKLPAQSAQALARVRQQAQEAASGGPGGFGGPGGPGRFGGGGPAGPGAGPGGGRGGRGGPGGDLQQAVDQSPKMALSELKNGDAIIILSTAGQASDHLTAITLVAGVEPILTAPGGRGNRDMTLGGWSLEGPGGGGGP